MKGALRYFLNGNVRTIFSLVKSRHFDFIVTISNQIRTFILLVSTEQNSAVYCFPLHAIDLLD